jgi:hypothetical protein
MSEDQAAAQETSSEDKFFGVKTTITGPDSDMEVEVVDDRPPEDRRAPANKAQREDSVDEEEYQNYSKSVQDRIKKLSFQKNEERRRAEAAEREREEAVRVAKIYSEDNRKYHAIIEEGERHLVHQIRERAALQVQQAQNKYRQAYEEGNTDKIIEAQQELINSQAGLNSADYQFNQVVAQRQHQQAAQQPAPQPQAVQPPPQQQPPVQMDKKSAEWTEKNKDWFGQNRRMSGFAYGLHEELVEEQGYDPRSDEYFEKIDSEMRGKFPEYFQNRDGEPETIETVIEPSRSAKSPSVVVAPSSRNNGAMPRKIRLTRSQDNLRKRLGLTAEQYARQLARENL